jgi:hypothetical protein
MKKYPPLQMSVINFDFHIDPGYLLDEKYIVFYI